MNDNIINETEVHNVEMTAGEMLRNARTTGRRKREIPTIAKQLCIREEFLQALEDGDYSVIPEPVYILGFARNYAMELGLNPDEVVAKIKREMGLVSDCAPEGDTAEGVSCVVPGAAAGIVNRALGFVRRKWKWFAGGAVLIAALIIGIVMLSVSLKKDATDVEPTVVAIEPTPVATEPAYAKTVRERFGTENREKSNVVLQAVQDGWVKIEDARGNTVFSRVLVSGDVYYVPEGNGYKAIFGNAGGIDIWANGVLMEKAGPAHTRKSGISLSPENLKPAAPTAADAE
ncbi:MAG: DUF4115 domain-containing protein [Alphaproteobacteria bacterium]|nr:DUF4115 domain-containing protein [Alphaproteobacteria bacterium]